MDLGSRVQQDGLSVVGQKFASCAMMELLAGPPLPASATENVYYPVVRRYLVDRGMRAESSRMVTETSNIFREKRLIPYM